MKNWYTLHNLIYGDFLVYDSMYAFTSMPVRTLRKYDQYYILNDNIHLYLSDMDRFFANDLERKKKQLNWLESRI